MFTINSSPKRGKGRSSILISCAAALACATSVRQTSAQEAINEVSKQTVQRSSQSTGSPTLPPVYTGPKKRIAVINTDQQGNTAQESDAIKYLKLRSGIKTGDDVGLKLNSMLTTALQNTGRFVLVERQNFDDNRNEQALGAEGQTSEKTTVKKGGVLGAQILVRCTITEFVDDAVRQGGAGGVRVGPFALGGGNSSKKAKVVVDIKMWEAATSKIVCSEPASGTSESKSSEIAFGGFGGSALFGKSTNDPIEKATRDAIVNAVNVIVSKMEKVPWEGKIALVDKEDDGKPFYVLNRGENDGLKIGDQLVVTVAGKDILDPDTGESLGRSKDRVMGMCRVVWTSKNVSHVEPADGTVISVGNVLKIKE